MEETSAADGEPGDPPLGAVVALCNEPSTDPIAYLYVDGTRAAGSASRGVPGGERETARGRRCTVAFVSDRHSDLIRVIVVPVGAEAEVRQIESKLEVLQDLVDGFLEEIGLDGSIIAMVNEDGRSQELPKNERVGVPEFVGDFVVGRVNRDTGQLVSLTDDDVVEWMKLLAPVEILN